MTDPSKAVFLSYASRDAQAAKRICGALKSAGIEVWLDQSELRGGDTWDQKIRHQIWDCALFIPIISASTVSPPEGYFRLERGLAEQRAQMIARNKAFIVPVCVDGTLEKVEDVPESFLRVQWTRLPVGGSPPSFCQRIAMLLGAGAASRATRGFLKVRCERLCRARRQGQSVTGHRPLGTAPKARLYGCCRPDR